MVIYTSPNIEPHVWRRRQVHNTQVRRLTLASLARDFTGFDAVQTIRRDNSWRNQASWLAGSPQARLAHYNPLVMSKLEMLNASAASNPFQTDYFVWLDAGIARTCTAALSHPGWLRQLPVLLQHFLILTYPYLGGTEIHGFPRAAIARMAGTDTVGWVARGGLFGGSAASIQQVRAHYEAVLAESLAAGNMGTEESVLTIVAHQHPEIFHRAKLGEDGLVLPFLQALITQSAGVTANEAFVPPVVQAPAPLPMPALGQHSAVPSLSVYILTFNCPAQLALLLTSWHTALHAFPALALYIVDNSTDAQCIAENETLCQYYGGTFLAQGNLGISGGRQFVAEHFGASGAPHMLFLEDDMLYSDADGECASGLPRRVENLLPRAQRIVMDEGLDFLKLSFTEFHGSNSQQWAWHNVSDERRAAIWPDYPRTGEGLALSEMPPTHFDHVGSLEGLRYATGEVFYCNWPQLVSRAGNRKMFLEAPLTKPHEGLWMAHFYECSRRRQLRSGVLMASPIEHRREYHYAAQERLES